MWKIQLFKLNYDGQESQAVKIVWVKPESVCFLNHVSQVLHGII
jgi:hypothetical protein